MKVKFTIEYNTSSCEVVYIKIGDSLRPLSTIDGSVWTITMELEPSTIVYSYNIVCNNALSRTECGEAHKVLLRKGLDELHIYDRWQEERVERSFDSALFSEVLLKPEKRSSIQPRKSSVVIAVDLPSLKFDEQLFILGESEQLGAWCADRAVRLTRQSSSRWSTPQLKGVSGVYKFAISKIGSSDLIWEEGENRHFDDSLNSSAGVLLNVKSPRFNRPAWRGAGVAIPLFSLKSNESMGVGEFHDLKKLVDWACATGMSIIQLLPINDTTMYNTWEDSYPYNANSSFALHPQYISLLRVGKLSDEKLYAECIAEGERLNGLAELDYVAVNALKHRYLKALYKEIGEQTLLDKSFVKFFKANREWLEPYALYSYLRDRYSSPDSSQWGDDAKYSKKLLKYYTSKGSNHYDAIAYYYFVQYHLHLQLLDAKQYAQQRRVAFKGDIPIGVSRNSVDVWVDPRLFRLDSQAGAPPDDFSVMGQNWGFPTYNWEEMSRDNYAWWVARFTKMAEYFDAYRIDHILGFFRIWEISTDAIHGLQGTFNPSMPYSRDEIEAYGFHFEERFAKPYIAEWMVDAIFKERADEVKLKYLTKGEACDYQLIAEYSSQAKIAASDIDDALKGDLMSLLNELLFIGDRTRKGMFHPRISAYSSYLFKTLSDYERERYMALYNDFYYYRHNDFWRDNALKKLPQLISATSMLTCGEDLGMIPSAVPEVMNDEQILSLEIERMPKEPWRTFGDTNSYPYRSVCTTSTHDMNPVRAWWLEDKEITQRYFNCVLGYDGVAPAECEAYICEKIIENHLSSPAMWTILPLQDWLALDPQVRRVDAAAERINIPSSSRHYWRYRMHITINELLDESDLNDKINSMIALSAR